MFDPPRRRRIRQTHGFTGTIPCVREPISADPRPGTRPTVPEAGPEGSWLDADMPRLLSRAVLWFWTCWSTGCRPRPDKGSHSRAMSVGGVLPDHVLCTGQPRLPERAPFWVLYPSDAHETKRTPPHRRKTTATVFFIVPPFHRGDDHGRSSPHLRVLDRAQGPRPPPPSRARSRRSRF